MSLPEPEVRKIADRLLEAARTGQPIPPLTSECPELDLPGAYAIQSAEFDRLGAVSVRVT